MEQHPVPQQISSYQFRLVGDMTLKQFFQIAGGALLALLVYASPIPALFKWPLIAFLVITGAALAFLPIEERPLEVWIIAFFKSIYSPTLFYWKKYDPSTKYFVDDTQMTATAALPVASPAIAPTDSKNNFLAKLEEDEKKFFAKVTGLFSSTSTTPTSVAPEAKPIEPAKIEEKKVIAVPEVKPLYVAPQPKAVPAPTSPPVEIKTAQVGETLFAQNSKATSNPQFSPNAAPPMPTNQPNIIVGQVMDSQSQIVEGAILEIRDAQGRPVRALRSNKAGHFLIVTPLANGQYELMIEKEGLVFEPLILNIKGEVIQPLAIKSK